MDDDSSEQSTTSIERWKKQQEEAAKNGVKQQALRELLKLRKAQGGTKYGDLHSVIKKYNQNGFDYITKGVLDKMLLNYKKGKLALSDFNEDSDQETGFGLRRKQPPPAASSYNPGGPDAKRLKKEIENAVKIEAARELLRNRAENDVRSLDAEKIAEIYNNLGYTYVNKKSLTYYASLLEKHAQKKHGKQGKPSTETQTKPKSPTSALARVAVAAKPGGAINPTAASTTSEPVVAVTPALNDDDTTCPLKVNDNVIAIESGDDGAHVEEDCMGVSTPPSGAVAATDALVHIENDLPESMKVSEEGVETTDAVVGESPKEALSPTPETKEGKALLETVAAVYQTTTTTPHEYVRNKGGRPKGSFSKGKISKSNEKPKAVYSTTDPQISELTTKASQRYMELRQLYREHGQLVPNGSLDKIIEELEQEAMLPPGSISKPTVISRVKRNNPEGKAIQKTTPLEDAEPAIIEYCVKLVRMGQPLFRDQVTSIAQHLIKGTPIEERLIKFKKRRFLLTSEEEKKEETAQVGIRWFSGFMARHQEQILSKSNCSFRYVPRIFMIRLEHFKTMYDIVYEAMVKSGVAERLSNPVLFDIEGSKVGNSDREWAYGLPTNFKILKPDYILYVDELGSRNRDKECERALDGQMLTLDVDCTPGRTGDTIRGETKKMHFSVYNFINAIGESVMCAVILKSDKQIDEIPLSVKWGIDTFIPLREAQTELELFEQNRQRGQAMQGGPVCSYMGKNIPCFVGTSSTGSLNSDLLLDICQSLDRMEIFDRSSGLQPYLLLDGHSSRLDIPFVDYILDGRHPWTVCVGLPPGSHLLEVADALEFNSSLVEEFAKAKAKLLSYRSRDRKHFYPSDIMPLINHAWSSSFSDLEATRKVLAQRGWNPMNYALLLHPQLNKRQHLTDTDTKV